MEMKTALEKLRREKEEAQAKYGILQEKLRQVSDVFVLYSHVMNIQLTISSPIKTADYCSIQLSLRGLSWPVFNIINLRPLKRS